KGLIKLKNTENKENGTIYNLDYIYGEKLNMSVNTYSINNTKFEVNVKVKDKEGNVLENKNYKYSIDNGLWYEKIGDTYNVYNKINKLVDKQINLPSKILIENNNYPEELWWINHILL
ncbi:MAG: hypothetical protein ACOCV8_06015, partial [Spirochaetota bacterium]